MKLLLDQNLSNRIPLQVAEFFPDSSHVKAFHLESESDEVVWQFAREQGFAILTKDWDFHQMSMVRGYPPKVIFLKIGNSTTNSIISLLSQHKEDICEFLTDGKTSLLILER